MMGRRFQCFASLCLFMLSNLWLSIGVSTSGREFRIVHEGYEVPHPSPPRDSSPPKHEEHEGSHTRPHRKLLVTLHKDFEAPTTIDPSPTRIIHEDYEGPHTHPPRSPPTDSDSQPTEHGDSYEQAELESKNEKFSSTIFSQEITNDYGPPRPNPRHTPPLPEH